MKKNLRFLTVILLAALCLLFAGCAEQAAEPDGSAQDLLNLNDGADEVPADDGLDDTADESYPAEEDLAAFAGTYTCRTQGAEWSDLEIYDDGSWTLYGTDATRTGTLVYEEEYEMYYAYNDADNSGCQFNRDESGEIYMGAYGYFVPTSAPSNEDAGGDGEYVDYEVPVIPTAIILTTATTSIFPASRAAGITTAICPPTATFSSMPTANGSITREMKATPKRPRSTAVICASQRAKPAPIMPIPTGTAMYPTGSSSSIPAF